MEHNPLTYIQNDLELEGKSLTLCSFILYSWERSHIAGVYGHFTSSANLPSPHNSCWGGGGGGGQLGHPPTPTPICTGHLGLVNCNSKRCRMQCLLKKTCRIHLGALSLWLNRAVSIGPDKVSQQTIKRNANDAIMKRAPIPPPPPLCSARAEGNAGEGEYYSASPWPHTQHFENALFRR
jgi:hypothetical protein